MQVERNVPDRLSKLKEEAIKDRSFMDKGILGFVSFIRGYREHHCNYIFRIKDLDFGLLAKSYALLKVRKHISPIDEANSILIIVKLPKMPELRKVEVTNFEPIPEQEIEKISYKNKEQEQARQRKLKERREQAT